MRVSPKSLILDLLSSVRGREMPVRALIAAAEVFGISAESLRVALVRLLERGLIARNERGQYGMAPAAQPVQSHVVSWTRIEDRLAAWRGAWVAVHTAGLGRSARAQLRRRERAMQFLGLRPLERDLWVRPDNLRGGVGAVRAELYGLGLEPAAPVFGLTDLDADTEARARRLWDASQLRRAYRDLTNTLELSAAHLPQLPVREAMVESFLLGGRAIRQIALDPLLPEPLVPAADRAALVDTLRRYDQLGRSCWRPFMEKQGAPHLRMPRRMPDLQPAQGLAAEGL
jgi:phenylacetic acid degradation operon negative regulatory protein